MNDTKLSWTDADLADAVTHAHVGGIETARHAIRQALALQVANAIGTIHETRVDSKQYPIALAVHAALEKAYAAVDIPIKIDLDDCNCGPDA